MMNLEAELVVWLVSWSFVGSTLGFFTLRNKPQWTILQKLSEYLKSIGVGMFFAFPTFMFLYEEKIFSPPLNMMIAGSLAFAITDVIINLWPKLIDGIGALVIKLAEKWLGIGNKDGNRDR